MSLAAGAVRPERGEDSRLCRLAGLAEAQAGRIAWAVILLGAALRLFRLGALPAGLNSDEAAAALEALALLQDGTDRWGHPWPVYFPGWGSGLSVLYSYLAAPVLWLLGPGALSIRLVNAVFGCLTLPVAWLVARREFGALAGLVATALLAFLPWHLMMSRWALDANLLPFWFTLGLLTLGTALRPDARPWTAVVALLPWAIGAYAYAAGVVPMALTALILLGFRWPDMASRRGWWVLGALAALAIDAPFLLFLVKNQLLHRDLAIEAWLPFSVPPLPSSRLSQAQEAIPIMAWRNLVFFLGGWRDGLLWNHSEKFLPLSGLMPWLLLVGVAERGLRVLRGEPPGPAFAATLAIGGVAFLFLFNINRINWFFVPALMLAAHGLVQVQAAVAGRRVAAAVAAGFLLCLGGYAGAFILHYFTRYNAEIIRAEDPVFDGFRVGLREALAEAVAAARPGEPILAEVGTFHPYVWILVFGQAELEALRRSRMEIRGGIFHVRGMGRFSFERQDLPPGRPFVFLVKPQGALPCAAPRILRADELWTLGRCPGDAG